MSAGPACWKCQDIGSYRVCRWNWIDGGTIVLKPCACKGESKTEKAGESA